MSQKRSQVEQENLKFQKVALLLGVVLFGLKSAAYIITNSNAILTDALEGLVNILGAGFGLFSLYYATLPKDENHPYGHGKIEFISSGFEGGLILVAGVSMIAKAIYTFFFPEEINMNLLGISLVVIAGILNTIMGWSMQKQGEKVNSVQLQAGGKHLLSDGYSTGGLILGLTIVWATDVVALDNVLAILLGVIISVTGVKIIRKSIAGVMDEADPDQLNQVATIVNEQRASCWVDMHNLKIVRYGAKIHLDAHLTLPWFFSLQESHEQVNVLEEVLNKAFDNAVEASIHMEPCLPKSCSICQFTSCTFRKDEMVKKIEWNGSHLYSSKHHHA
ncbi:MAG: cation diffusion facilitator family transporter [Salibacteraceae bacterium]